MTRERFEGKVAIVTGGSAGIGAATVKEFAEEGASVVFVSRNQSRGEEFQEALTREGYSVRFVQGDVGREEDCRRTVDQALAAFGRVDCLVNNAVSTLIKGVAASAEDWHANLAVSLVGAAIMARMALESMKRLGKGTIVNVSSVSGYIAQPNHWTYNAAKGGLLTLTKCMAMDLAQFGIRVNSVSPGWIWTSPVSIVADGDRHEFDKKVAPFHLLGRCGDAREVARAILFLCSDDASFITGTDLAVDGGYLAIGAERMFQASL